MPRKYTRTITDRLRWTETATEFVAINMDGLELAFITKPTENEPKYVLLFPMSGFEGKYDSLRACKVKLRTLR